MKTHAIRIDEHGDASTMRWEVLELPDPGPGEAQIRHHAVGLNYIDVYHRTGLYPVPALPSGLGIEGAGVVVSVGEGVIELTQGDRVAYATPPIGVYAEARNLPTDWSSYRMRSRSSRPPP